MKSDKTLKFYTGLASATVFGALLQLVLSVWAPPQRTCLDAEQQLLLVLMRLRLGLVTNDLAYRFGISAGSVSSIFHSVAGCFSQEPYKTDHLAIPTSTAISSAASF
ncbi:hypothetical protein HPB50_011682 [Hyalomma asiaticum]|uniref:Uncharacterized protein n=1 Tax=Hyalomma asiaticum TaxID=266040 RepID=A0ACB7SUX3_HYAAI|nr:hypothetical protein HPB50_011682 [Hyalomma asiaticum]